MKAAFDNSYRKSFFTYFIMNSDNYYVFLTHIYTINEKNYIFIDMLPSDNV